MKRTVVTPAAIPPAALSELKDWLGISTVADDAQLTALLRASFEMCEHFTGAMPLQQGCEEVLRVSADWQVLTARPVQAIIGIDGLPADGPRFALPCRSAVTRSIWPLTAPAACGSATRAARAGSRCASPLGSPPTGPVCPMVCATEYCGSLRFNTARAKTAPRRGRSRPLRSRRYGDRGGGCG